MHVKQNDSSCGLATLPHEHEHGHEHAHEPGSADPAHQHGTMVQGIGRDADNDFVVDLPGVSGHHARILWGGLHGQALIEDLGSAEGTAVGAPYVKISRSVVFATDMIYLGNHAIPAAFLLARFEPSLITAFSFRGAEVVIGRIPSCDHVLDLPTITSRHARFRRVGDYVSIEDLGSKTGTFVNGQQIHGEIEIRSGDLISLGTYTVRYSADLPVDPKVVDSVFGVPALSLPKYAAPPATISPPPAPKPVLAPTAPANHFVPSAPAVAPAPAPAPAPVPSPAVASPPEIAPFAPRAVSGPCSISIKSASRFEEAASDQDVSGSEIQAVRLLLLLAQAPVAASALVATYGMSSTVEVIGLTLHGLSLIALWFGLSNALLAGLLEGDDLRNALSKRGAATLVFRVSVLLLLSLGQCAIAWAFLSWTTGLQGHGLPTIGIMVAGAAVGTGLGLLIVVLAERHWVAWAAVPLVVIAIQYFGSPQPFGPRTIGWAGKIHNANPSRWVFEALVLQESSTFSKQAIANGQAQDLVRVFFPPHAFRLGQTADLAALGLTALFLMIVAGGVALVRSRDSS
jgi:pSer/pThr/pTyr-binding forkhead associated (FHA) protein